MPSNTADKKKWWQGWAGLFNVALVVVFTFFFFLYIFDQQHRLADIFSLSPGSLVELFLFTWGIIVSFGLINFILYRRIECPVTLLEGITLAVVNILGNLLPFSGGLIGKGVYLKQRHQLSYRRYLSATVALYIIFMVANGLAGVLALVYIGVSDAWPVWYLFAGFACLVAPITVFFLPIGCLVPRRMKNIVHNAHNGWDIVAGSLSAISVIILIRLVGTCLTAGRFWLLFAVFSQPIDFVHCIVFASGAMLTRLVAVTPGGIGVRESIVGGLSMALGFQFGLAVVVTVIDRLVGVLSVGVVAALVLPWHKHTVS